MTHRALTFPQPLEAKAKCRLILQERNSAHRFGKANDRFFLVIFCAGTVLWVIHVRGGWESWSGAAPGYRVNRG